MIPFILLIFSLSTFEGKVFGVLIKEVNIGDTVKLKCPSNDETHRFQYWQLINDEIIGPWNNFKSNVKYEVTTGDLTIKEVSLKESGFYKCISKSLTAQNLHVKTVELIVNRDPKEERDKNSTINIYRGLIAFFFVSTLLILGAIAFIYQRRRRSRVYLQGREEELQDEVLIRSRGAYRPTTTPNYSSERKKRKASNEALIVDTLEEDSSNSFPFARL